MYKFKTIGTPWFYAALEQSLESAFDTAFSYTTNTMKQNA